MSDAQFQIPEGNLLELWKTPGTRLTNFTIKPMTGIDLIAQERLEQKTKHNHTIKTDYEQYPDFQLGEMAEGILSGNIELFPEKFDASTLKRMMRKSYKDRLIIAGALIAAQLDLLNFQE